MLSVKFAGCPYHHLVYLCGPPAPKVAGVLEGKGFRTGAGITTVLQPVIS